MLAVVVQDACAAVSEAADSPLLKPSRKLLPPQRREIDLAEAGTAPHPRAVSLQERGPELTVDQVPDCQPHLVLECGRPLVPADRRLGGARVPGQRRQWPGRVTIAAVEVGMQGACQ